MVQVFMTINFYKKPLITINLITIRKVISILRKFCSKVSIPSGMVTYWKQYFFSLIKLGIHKPTISKQSILYETILTLMFILLQFSARFYQELRHFYSKLR